ncbi:MULTISPECIES: hypothetical protein [unclassified Pseudoxanthomonas]|uniref:hypothetical protein n=1 Tax=unclassified Pseudoxanthomonas TaxID=2645906 RepID=UPI00161E59C5|nr:MULTISPECIES: hypothetical protein [unclassified Pseudoxanthomonas]MBB3276140.1 hypothetical protein [Pseudoxanthomonas sp. OG2]MBV7472780.1 hypothetical protein [Pseudoxanthomonas sp. PXM05]
MKLRKPYAIARSTAVALLIATFIYLGAYLLVVNGDAYQCAKSFVRSSEVISRQTGGIEKVWLAPFPLKIAVSGSSGNAEFSMIAVSDQGERHKVLIDLKKTLGQWRVTGVTLDALPLPVGVDEADRLEMEPKA